MREIISVQVGQCGNQVAAKFWQAISHEHAIQTENGTYQGHSDQQLDMIQTYFSPTQDGRFVPRAVLVDLEPSTLEEIRKGPLQGLFRQENFIHGLTGAGNNWGKGHYTDGAQLIDSVLDAIRRETEACDNPQAFQITHGIGGGTGSGMGTLLISKLREEFTDKIIESFTIFTSPKSDGIVEPYNNTLSVPHLIENVDSCIVFDNEALYDICFRTTKLTCPNYGDLNYFVSTSMSALTSYLRFPNAHYNGLIRNFTHDFVPFSRFHFFMVGIAPIVSRKSSKNRNLEASQLIQQALSPRNVLCDADSRRGTFFAANTVFRGMVSSMQAEGEAMRIQNNLSFARQVPKVIKLSACDIPIPDFKTAAASIINCTSIEHMFTRFSQQFTCMFRRRAFVHWYGGEGMDEMEFIEARQYTDDLITDYQEWRVETGEKEEWDWRKE